MKRKLFIPLLLVALACTQRHVYQTVGITVHTVDAAMNAWGAYVRANAEAAGVPPLDWNKPLQDKVRAGFTKYQEAVRVARTALVLTDTMPTPAELSAAAAALVDLIQTIVGKKVTP